MSFKNFEADHIGEVESFVKNELMEILTEKCQVNQLTFNENDKVFFFGIYASDYKKFRFVGGDKSIIKEVVDYVKTKITENGTEYFVNITVRAKHKIFLEDTCQLSVGRYFAKKNKTLDIPVVAAGERSVNQTDMKSFLFSKKLKPFFDALPSKMVPAHSITEDIVEIVKSGVKVFADVICPFCPEKRPHRIQCDVPATANVCYWNLSNFKKHVRKHERDERCNDENGNTTTFDEDGGNTELEDLQILSSKAAAKSDVRGKRSKLSKIGANSQRKIDANSRAKTKSQIQSEKAATVGGDVRNIIFQQISKQNLFMMSTTLKHNEESECMNFELNSERITLMVCEIDPYGSCLFGALAHQMYGCKIKSAEHEQKTGELRERAVNHIRSNFERFKFILKGRVYEESKDPVDAEEVDTECRVFLNSILPHSNCYGGTESIIAISEIMKVNIIIISEDGDCHMSSEFNSGFDITVFLAHRLSGVGKQKESTHNDDRNHYDSVVKIESNVLYKIAEYLNKKNVKKIAIRNNNASIVSLNSTLND